MKTVLVIGGAGYIGSHNVKYFLEKGYDVIVYDNLSKGHKELIDPRAKFIEADIFDEEKLVKAMTENKVDAVVHFAGFIEVGESVRNPLKYYHNNVEGTLKLLSAMIRSNVKKIVFSSSAAVYGEPEQIPIKENSPKKPTNPYGMSKLIIENVLQDFDKAYNIKSVSLRYFNAAGSAYNIGEMHEPETHLIPLILMSALKKRNSIKIFGNDYNTKDGTCIRDYVHVLDLAQGHYLALEHLFNNKESKAYNMGSGDGYSVKEIIDECKKICNIDFKVEIEQRRDGDPASLVASPSLIKKELGWNPQFDIKKIITSAWEWHKKL